MSFPTAAADKYTVMWRGIVSKRKIIFGILVGILLVLVFLVGLCYQLYAADWSSFKSVYGEVLRGFNPSQAKISLESGEFKIAFSINATDQINLQNLSKDLPAGNLENQELSIKLGSEAFTFMDKMFKENRLTDEKMKPLILNLRILPREIDFDNNKVFGPFEEPREGLLESPSVEGSIKTQVIGSSGYLIEINNPEQVFSESITSGKLKVSAQLADSGWWQLLSKLAKIQLKIDDGSLSGTIFLK